MRAGPELSGLVGVASATTQRSPTKARTAAWALFQVMKRIAGIPARRNIAVSRNDASSHWPSRNPQMSMMLGGHVA